MSANVIEFDYSNNSSLKSFFANMDPGDFGEIKIKFQLISADENIARATMKKIIHPEIRPRRDDEDDGSTPDAEEPAMVVMSGGGKSKGNSRAEIY